MVGTWLTRAPRVIGGPAAFERVDLLDRKRTLALVARVRPDAILHLAAKAHPRDFEIDPWACFETNTRVTLHVMQAASASRRAPRVVLVSSGEAYGAVRARPHREGDPLAPSSFYGASKAASEALARASAASREVPLIVARPFNHAGPGQSARYVCSRLALAAARLELSGSRRAIELGNLDARRDFLDVRDVARAYADLIERGKSGETYNVCSGRAIRIRQVAVLLAREIGRPLKLRSSASRRRPGDLPLLVGSRAKARREIGFRPRYSLSRTLKDLFDYWIERGAEEREG